MSKNNKTDEADETGREKEPRSAMKSKIEQIEDWIKARNDIRRNTVLMKMELRDKEAIGAQWKVMDDPEEKELLYDLCKAGFTKPEGMVSVILGRKGIPEYNPIDEFYRNTRLTTMGNVTRLLRCVELDPSIDQTFDGMTYRQAFENYMLKWLKACYFCMTGRKHNDVMLLLVGPQGTRKTSFLNHLTPPQLKSYSYTGHIEPSLGNYMTASYLAEKIFINVDDQMENIFGKDYNSMKSIISQDTVTRRLLYHRHSMQQRRIANFCGSVNETGFLMDSNNRRYLCFQVANISEDYMQVDTSQLWAEIAQLVKEGNDSIYQFTQHDYEVIDLIDELCAAPMEECELLNSCFEPASPNDGPGETYYMQFGEILGTLKKIGDNSGLRQYNLKTALRKYKFVSRPIRRPERGDVPYRLYAVRLRASCTQYQYLFNICQPWRAAKAEATALPPEPPDTRIEF
ncbi:MAG: hypothetical protein IJU81_02615 [Bacteroidales bacterium]|nr:hypothetical protein [Bacteroidales bacterium]